MLFEHLYFLILKRMIFSVMSKSLYVSLFYPELLSINFFFYRTKSHEVLHITFLTHTIDFLSILFSYISILHFTFLFSLFVFVNAAGHYFRIWTSSIWTGQVPTLFQVKSIIQQIASVHIIFFGVTNRSIYCHMTLSAMNYLLYIYILCSILHRMLYLCIYLFVCL